MGKRRGRGLPAGAKQVRDGIEHWRKTRAKRCRMPEPLWDEAVALAQAHGVYRISQALRLSYDSLNVRVARAPKTRPKSARSGSSQVDTSGFVELRAAAPVTAMPPAGAEVEVLDADGTKLTIRLAAGSDLDISALMSAFQSRRR